MTKKKLAQILEINQNQISQIIYGQKSGPASERYMKNIIEYLEIEAEKE